MDSSIKCPCCGQAAFLKAYQTRKDLNGKIVSIDICEYCTAIVNRSTLEEAAASEADVIDLQASSSRAFYDLDKMRSHLAEEVSSIDNTIRFMFDNASRPIRRGVAIDLGAGLGHMAAAACRHFDQSWAIDINRWTLDQMLPAYNAPTLHAGVNLDEVPSKASAIFMWHTLEHIPKAWEVGIQVSEKLETDGVFFWQVPMYADAHIVDSHYTFFNRNSARYFAKRIGLELENIWFDTDNQFLTCLYRKSA